MKPRSPEKSLKSFDPCDGATTGPRRSACSTAAPFTVVGVDPGLASTGVAVVRGTGLKPSHYSFGVIRTKASASLGSRLDAIFTSLLTILEREKPHLLLLEDVFSLQKHPKSGISLGHVCGVIQLAGERSGVPATVVSVREAKKVLTGNGAATKDQLERAVRNALRLSDPIRPDHASDALAIALTGLFRYGFTLKKIHP